MLSALIEALKGIIGLLKIAKEDKKMNLEIQKISLEKTRLEHEAKERERLIVPATIDDVKKYDPRYGAIERRIEAEHEVSRPMATPHRPSYAPSCSLMLISWFVFVALITYLVSLYKTRQRPPEAPSPKTSVSGISGRQGGGATAPRM